MLDRRSKLTLQALHELQMLLGVEVQEFEIVRLPCRDALHVGDAA